MSVSLQRSNATDSYEVLSSYTASPDQLEVAIVDSLVKGNLSVGSNNTYTSPANGTQWAYTKLANQYVDTSAISNYPSGTVSQSSVISMNHIPPASPDLNSYSINLGNNAQGNTSVFSMSNSSASIYDSNYVVTQSYLNNFFDNDLSLSGSTPAGATVLAQFDQSNTNFRVHYACNTEWNSTLQYGNGELSTLVGTRPLAMSEDSDFNVNKALGAAGSDGSLPYSSKYALSNGDGSLTLHDVDPTYQPLNNGLSLTERTDFSSFNESEEIGIFRITQVLSSSVQTSLSLDSTFINLNLANPALPIMDANANSNVINPDTNVSLLSIPKALTNQDFYSIFNTEVKNTVADGYGFELIITEVVDSGYHFYAQDIIDTYNLTHVNNPYNLSDLKLLISDLNSDNLYDNAYYYENCISLPHSINFSNASLNISTSTNGVQENINLISIDLTEGETLPQNLANVNGQIKINTNTPQSRITDFTNENSSITPNDVYIYYTGENTISHAMRTNPYIKINIEKVALRTSIESANNYYLKNNNAFLTLYTNSIVNTNVDVTNASFFFDSSVYTDDSLRIWSVESINSLVVSPNSFYAGYDESNNVGQNIIDGITVQAHLQNLTENLTTYESYRAKITPKVLADISLTATVQATSNWSISLNGTDSFLISDSTTAFNNVNKLPKYDPVHINRINNNETVYYKYEYLTLTSSNIYGSLTDYVEVSYAFDAAMTNPITFTISQSELTKNYQSGNPPSIFVVDSSLYQISNSQYSTDQWRLVQVTKQSLFDVSFAAKYGNFNNIKLSINGISQTDSYYALQNKTSFKLANRNSLQYVNAPTISNLTIVSESLSPPANGSFYIMGTFVKNDLYSHTSLIEGRSQATNQWSTISNSSSFDPYYSLSSTNTLTIDHILSGQPDVQIVAEFSPFNTIQQFVNLNQHIYYIPFNYNPSDVLYSVSSFESNPSELANLTNLGTNFSNYLTVTNNYSCIDSTSWNSSNYTITVSDSDPQTNVTTFKVLDVNSRVVFTMSQQSNQIFLGKRIISHFNKDIYRARMYIGESSSDNTLIQVFQSSNYENSRIKFTNAPGIEVFNSLTSNVAGSGISFRVLGDFVTINPIGLVANPVSSNELGLSTHNSGSLLFQHGASQQNYSGKFTFEYYRGHNDSNTGVQTYTINRDLTSITFNVGSEFSQVLTTNMYFGQSLNINDLKNSSNVTCANLNVTFSTKYSLPPSNQILSYPVSLIGDNVSITITNSKYQGQGTNLEVPTDSTPVDDPKSYVHNTTLASYGKNDLYTFSGEYLGRPNHFVALRPCRLKIRNAALPHGSLVYTITLGTPNMVIHQAIAANSGSSKWLGNPALIGDNDPLHPIDNSKWRLLYVLSSYEQKTAGVSIGKYVLGQSTSIAASEAVSYYVSLPAFYRFDQVSSYNNLLTPYEYSALSAANKVSSYLPRVASAVDGSGVYNPFLATVNRSDVTGSPCNIVHDPTLVNNVQFTIFNQKSTLDLVRNNPNSTRFGILVPGPNVNISLSRGLFPSISNNTQIYSGPITSITKNINVLNNKIVFRNRENNGSINFSILQFPQDIGYVNDLTSYQKVFKTTDQSYFYNIDFNLGNIAWSNNNSPTLYFNANANGNRPTLYTVVDINDSTTKTNLKRIYKYSSLGYVDIENTTTLQTLSLTFSGGRSYYDVPVSQTYPFPNLSTAIWDYNTLVANTNINSNLTSIPWVNDGDFNSTAYVNWSFGNSVTGQLMPNELCYLQSHQKKWVYVGLKSFYTFTNQFGLKVAEIGWDGSLVTPLVKTASINLSPVLASPSLGNNTYETEQYSTSTLN